MNCMLVRSFGFFASGLLDRVGKYPGAFFNPFQIIVAAWNVGPSTLEGYSLNKHLPVSAHTPTAREKYLFP